jgi:hypothetical protein
MIIENCKKIALLTFILASLVPVQTQAGFGISPPYVRNESLSRGSSYIEKIYIIRNEAESEEAWRMTITPDVGDIEEWFSIDRGMEFVIPAGEEKFPIYITVDVPKRAKYDHYTGALRIKGLVDKPFDQEGGISLAIGGRIDVDIIVNDFVIEDFIVRGVHVYDMETGYDTWWGGFRKGIIQFGMTIENVGNVDASPSSVELDIYNSTTGELLEQLVNYNKMKKVDAFHEDDTLAEFKTDLPMGSYRAEFRIYKGDEIMRTGDSTLSVLPFGTLPSKGLSIWIWIALVVGAIIILGVFFFVFRKRIAILIRKIKK